MDDEFIYPLNRHLTPYYESQDKDTVKLYHGNCIDVLKKMSGNSVQCCVTSPPYWGLRDYGTAEWEGGDENCDHKCPYIANSGGGKSLNERYHGTNREGKALEKQQLARNFYKSVCGKCGAIRIDEQIGSERTVDEYVAKMVQVFREVKRVLSHDGTLWLNLGDTYGSSNNRNAIASRTLGGTSRKPNNAKLSEREIELANGNLVGVPWRVAFALQQDGWVLRQDIIWHKPNPMPESVTNRCTKAHEYIFLLTKSMDYYYDNEAVKRKLKSKPHNPGNKKLDNSRNDHNQMYKVWGSEEGGNLHSIWTVTTQPYPEAHFATFPRKLIEPCILSGSRENDIILDPFMGAATTAVTAIGHRRKTWGIELNEEYIKLQIKRIEETTQKNTNVWQYMNRHFIKQG